MTRGGIVRRVDGIGERSVSSTPAELLALTSDAVLAFDGSGRILLANDAAEAVFVHGAEGLADMDVRALFPPAIGVVPELPFSPSNLPFSLDGQATVLTCMRANGLASELSVRCERVASVGETYLLVAHEAHASEAAQSERERLVEELSRANHRLSGTLRIVLDTLDSNDVRTLFERVLEEITETMEASGTVFYIAERDGYHLRGTSSSLEGMRVPRFMAFGRTIETLATRAGRSLRLRVLAPEGKELRQGRLAWRDVVDEGTREIHRVRASVLPPFASFVAVPVWFGGRVIALIEVGWRQVHPLRREDAELLDAVAQYLAVQLAGAFSALRSRKEDHLANVASELRESFMGAGEWGEGGQGDERRFSALLGRLCGELDATGYVLHLGRHGEGPITLDLPEGPAPIDVDLGRLLAPDVSGEAVVEPLDEAMPLSGWLAEHQLSGSGAFLDLGVLWGVRRVSLLLRPEDSEPFDDLELSFLRGVSRDIRDLSLGEEERRQDKHIAQALQTGMRNELQRVDGISAQGIYSSATAAAVIGGDFYDLIRLPQHRACVIMGDVSGKGVEAASVSAAVKTALGAYSWQGLPPARMVRLLNEFLLGFSRVETFATLFVGIADLTAGMLTYCSAGHPPAILVRAATGEIESLDVQSGVVGAFHEMSYRNGHVRLARGDMLLLYTDGTTEARAANGAFFGEDGLRDAVMSQAPLGFEGFLDRMLDVLDGFTDRSLEDDVAMVCLRFDGDGGISPRD